MGFIEFESKSELVCYITAVMCGISMLLPVNAVFSAPAYIMNYYQYVMKDPDAVAEYTNFWSNAMTYYILVCLVVSLVVEPLTLTRAFRRYPLQVRMLSALGFLWTEIVLLMVVPAIGSTEIGAIATLVAAEFISGAGKSVFESTVYGMFSQFPSRYMAAAMTGAGVAGALTSTIQVIVRKSLSEDYDSIRKQSKIYYGLMVGLQGITFIMLVLLRWNSFAAKYMSNFGVGTGAEANKLDEKKSDEVTEITENAGNAENTENTERMPVEPSDGNELAEKAEADEAVEADGADIHDEEAQLANTDVFFVLRTVFPMLIACSFNFMLTLMLFPQVSVNIDSDDYWFGTLVVFVFNVSDVFGRFAPTLRFLWPPQWLVLVGSFARVIFLPLILLASYHYIPTHAFGYVMMVLFGFTNGYIGALTLVLGPLTKGITTSGQRFVAGTMLGISILAGGAIGTSLSIMMQTIREKKEGPAP